jgi:hypothetical protein
MVCNVEGMPQYDKSVVLNFTSHPSQETRRMGHPGYRDGSTVEMLFNI